MDYLKTMQNFLKEVCHEMGLQQDVEILEIQRSGRWVLGYTQHSDFPNFGHAMIRLERALKVKTGVLNIDLVLESLEDKNKRAARNGRDQVKLVSVRGVDSLD